MDRSMTQATHRAFTVIHSLFISPRAPLVGKSPDYYERPRLRLAEQLQKTAEQSSTLASPLFGPTDGVHLTGLGQGALFVCLWDVCFSGERLFGRGADKRAFQVLNSL